MAQPISSLQRQSDFQTQGQVDWTALGKSSINLSVEVLARLSKAGLDAITVGMARAICQGLVLPPEAQRRVHVALKSLRSFSSYGQVLWIGFGVRHIIHELAVSEQGLTCVALCAALRTSYDSWFSANVLRNLGQIRRAPSELMPAIHQWQVLTDVCAGSLSSSKFPTLVDGFRRIIVPLNARSAMPVKEATSAEALSEALSMLAEVSAGRMASCTFFGGIDCAWLAAVAEWICCLNVEIRSKDEVLYRSGAVNSYDAVQITIHTSDSITQSTEISSKSFFLPSGQSIIHERSESGGDWLEPKAKFWARSTWSNILRDSFGFKVHTLLDGDVGKHFFTLLKFSMDYWHWQRTSPLSNDIDRAYRLRRTLHTDVPYLEFPQTISGENSLIRATRCLPELEPYLQQQDQQENGGRVKTSEAYASLQLILNICACNKCRPKPNIQIFEAVGHICMTSLARTIIRLISLLLQAKIHRDVLPLPTGVLQFYETTHRTHYMPNPSITRTYEWFSQREETISDLLELFTGTRNHLNNSIHVSDWVALSQNGLCASLQLLQDPSCPPYQAGSMVLIPGSIQFDLRMFKGLRDARCSLVGPWPGVFPDVRMVTQFVVEETPSVDRLKCYYMTSPRQSTDVSHHTAKHRITPRRWDIYGVAQRINYGLKTICETSSETELGSVQDELQTGKQKWRLNLQSTPLCRVRHSLTGEREDQNLFNISRDLSLKGHDLLIWQLHLEKGTVRDDTQGEIEGLDVSIHRLSGIDINSGDHHEGLSMAGVYANLASTEIRNWNLSIRRTVFGDVSHCPSCIVRATLHCSTEEYGHLQRFVGKVPMEGEVIFHEGPRHTVASRVRFSLETHDVEWRMSDSEAPESGV